MFGAFTRSFIDDFIGFPLYHNYMTKIKPCLLRLRKLFITLETAYNAVSENLNAAILNLFAEIFSSNENEKLSE